MRYQVQTLIFKQKPGLNSVKSSIETVQNGQVIEVLDTIPASDHTTVVVLVALKD
jgi:hypothetical protein